MATTEGGAVFRVFALEIPAGASGGEALIAQVAFERGYRRLEMQQRYAAVVSAHLGIKRPHAGKQPFERAEFFGCHIATYIAQLAASVINPL